ncbi:hypothetical protein OH76DRAFT_788851 [Lentinus brumalis]|uniref:F-box domain-containing protein n=1 Tax=Lentinus brumalis TaxID=2498619 RepID=A0A371D401_9APHY|nr:hypothetical protein OH76DRAFT_788851 [Polyporus brumalis]
MPPDASAVCTPAGPFPLASFTIGTHSQERSSLKGGLRVLSLFDPVAWSSLDFDRFDVDESFEPQWLHRPLDLRRLNLSRSSGSSPKHTASVMQALSMSLKSDSLQELYVQVDSKDTVVALGKLLSYAGRNITTLAIQNDGSYTSTRDGWVDPLEGNWRMLNLSACTKLESISLLMHFREKPTRPLSETPVGIIQQAPPSLRMVTIDVYCLPKSTTIGNRSVFKIHDFDKVLSTMHFPHLQGFELHICPDSSLQYRNGHWPKCVASPGRPQGPSWAWPPESEEIVVTGGFEPHVWADWTLRAKTN